MCVFLSDALAVLVLVGATSINVVDSAQVVGRALASKGRRQREDGLFNRPPDPDGDRLGVTEYIVARA